MPTRHGIEVLVTSTTLEPLIEYGSQIMGRAAYLSKIISTRIEAKDGFQFYIRIKPQLPFPLNHTDLEDDEDSTVKNPFTSILVNHDYLLRRPRRFDENTPIEEQEQDDNDVGGDRRVTSGLIVGLRRPSTPATSDLQLTNASTSFKNALTTSVTVSRRTVTRSTSSNLTFAPIQPARPHLRTPSTPTSSNISAFPPFDLTASVYIDGHEKPECRQVIYLNPNHPKFYTGGFVFKGRWVAPPPTPPPPPPPPPPPITSSNGLTHASPYFTMDPAPTADAHVSVRNWVFQSVPVSMDSLTDRFMTVCSTTDPSTPPAPLQSEADRLLNDLTSSLSSNTDMLSAGHRPKPGQIEIRVRRIVAGAASSKTPFKAYHYAGADETVDPSTTHTGATNSEDPTHMTALRPQLNSTTGQEEKVKLNTVPWRAYRKGEDVYAKFVFNYSGREKLVKLGLCDEMGQPTLAGRVNVPDVGAPISRKRGFAQGGRYARDEDDEPVEEIETEGAQFRELDTRFTAATVGAPPPGTHVGGRVLRNTRQRTMRHADGQFDKYRLIPEKESDEDDSGEEEDVIKMEESSRSEEEEL